MLFPEPSSVFWVHRNNSTLRFPSATTARKGKIIQRRQSEWLGGGRNAPLYWACSSEYAETTKGNPPQSGLAIGEWQKWWKGAGESRCIVLSSVHLYLSLAFVYTYYMEQSPSWEAHQFSVASPTTTNQRASWGRRLAWNRKSTSLGLFSHSWVNRIAGLN